MHLTRRELLHYFGATAATGLIGPGCIGWTREEAIPVDSWHKSVCRFCGSGCETRVGLRGGKVVKVEGLQEGWNRGRLCIKGLLNREILYVSDRAQYPMVRKNGQLERVSWDEALDAAAAGFREAMAQGGPDAVAFYGSGQLFTQESYTANKLFKGGLGTNNVDGNPRLCMASAAFGYKSVFGADEPSGCYDDIEHATLFFVIGANMAECHPVVWERVRDRLRTAPETRVIVVDPRRTPTARDATLHLQIRPGTDVALLNAMAYELLRTGLVDPAFINDFVTFRKGTADAPPLTLEDFRAFLEDYAPEKVANLCGLSSAEIREAARLFGISQAALSFWTMGLNQQTHGVAANRMMMALHLLTGQIGRPGTGPFSLTGQTNAGGGVRDTGSLAHALPAGRLVTKAHDRQDMERLWGLPEGRISPNPGLSAVPLFEAMREGRVRAALVMATNPARSLPNADRYRVGMEKAFLVVSDSIFPTDTAKYADVFLPAAMWAEKEGVLSQSERRYHLVEKLVEPPGEARSDLDILVALGERLGHGALLKARTPEAVWDEWRMVSAGTTYDFSGMTYARLKALPGLIWPCPTEQHPGTCRRYVPGEDPLAKKEGRIDFYARPDGRAVVFLSEQGPFREDLTSDYPMTLTTGRRLEHWHTATLTGRIAQLQGIDIDSLEIHPGDAAVMGVKEGELVQVTSARGSVRLKALPSMRVRPGVVFALMHSTEHLVNAATSDYLDPTSAQPEYKLAAVRVERVKEGT
ncbi:molybdopterin oxidoreductase family protein [Cystobacter fuscus]|uniref:molybdopterin oxidoreductase family protein n=1 Tax=Cystobacter fuscus TaxID=43 RepID=UPI002B280477|nr:molybdopterin-dependent oxidoreductase [Cystobacter fuscus]